LLQQAAQLLPERVEVANVGDARDRLPGRAEGANALAGVPVGPLLTRRRIGEDGELALIEVSDTQRAIRVAPKDEQDLLAHDEFGTAIGPGREATHGAAELLDGQIAGGHVALEHLLQRQRDVGEDLALGRIPVALDGLDAPHHDGYRLPDEVVVRDRHHDRGRRRRDSHEDQGQEEQGQATALDAHSGLL
jgi:hypothetical protein